MKHKGAVQQAPARTHDCRCPPNKEVVVSPMTTRYDVATPKHLNATIKSIELLQFGKAAAVTLFAKGKGQHNLICRLTGMGRGLGSKNSGTGQRAEYEAEYSDDRKRI